MLSHPKSTQSRPTLARRSRGVLASMGALGMMLLASFTLLVCVGAARAASPIEGIWSFNGGEIAIQAQPDGTFTGTVVAATKFDKCEHAVQEEIWQDMTLQSDGSFWGTHQWFYDHDGNPCAPLAGGPTAWRILTTVDGSHYLKVCLSEPTGPQPTIAPDGTAANAQVCVNSDLVAPLPTISPNGTSVSNAVAALPSTKQCLAPKRLRIKLRDPEHDPLAKIRVTLRSGQIKREATIKRQSTSAVAILDLTGLTAPTFTVRVNLTTVLGSHLRGKRRYTLCGASAKPVPPKVHR